MMERYNPYVDGARCVVNMLHPVNGVVMLSQDMLTSILCNISSALSNDGRNYFGRHNFRERELIKYNDEVKTWMICECDSIRKTSDDLLTISGDEVARAIIDALKWQMCSGVRTAVIDFDGVGYVRMTDKLVEALRCYHEEYRGIGAGNHTDLFDFINMRPEVSITIENARTVAIMMSEAEGSTIQL